MSSTVVLFPHNCYPKWSKSSVKTLLPKNQTPSLNVIVTSEGGIFKQESKERHTIIIGL